MSYFDSSDFPRRWGSIVDKKTIKRINQREIRRYYALKWAAEFYPDLKAYFEKIDKQVKSSGARINTTIFTLPTVSREMDKTCGVCGRKLGVGYYYTCRICLATYCYAHAPMKCDHKRKLVVPA